MTTLASTPTRFRSDMGRRDRVIALLRTKRELCSLGDFYSAALSNGRNDIATLISEGWTIEKSWNTHGNMPHSHYKLIAEVRRQPTQTKLAV